MTETAQETQVELEVGYASGKSIPRKEDGRLVQGQGVFVDDVKRHGMGYVHFVRAPYAHAKIVSVDVSAAEALEGVYGTLDPDEVAELTDPFFELTTAPGIADQGLRARRRPRPPHRRAGRRRRRRDARARPRRRRPRRGRVRAARRARRRAHGAGRGAPVLHEDAGTNVVWSGTFDWGDVDGALKAADKVVKIKELHFDRFSSTPLECSAALVEYERGTGQFTIHCNHQMPGVAAIWMGPALRVPLDKLRFVTQDIGGGFGNKITTHVQLTACCLLARKLKRPIQWTEWRTDQHTANAHGNERWFHDIEVAVQNDGTMLGFKVEGARRLRRVPALRAARLHHLGAGHAGPLPLAEHPRRLHPGGDEQVAGGAEPRLLADAAALADRADLSTSSRTSSGSTRSRCGRRTTCAPRRCRTRRRTAASTTRATTRAASTSRSS